VTEEVEVPKFVFLGDTTDKVFTANPVLFPTPSTKEMEEIE